jgi:hypothetical protein
LCRDNSAPPTTIINITSIINREDRWEGRGRKEREGRGRGSEGEGMKEREER